jgi:hypothetical protein
MLDKLCITSSYTSLVRLSNLEGDASDLQTAVDTLNANRQNTFANALVAEGQTVLDCASLNKIGIQDDTLAIETGKKVTNLGVHTEKIREERTAIGDATLSKAVLTETATIRSIKVDSTLSIAEANNVISLSGQKQMIGEANSHWRCYQLKGCSCEHLYKEHRS